MFISAPLWPRCRPRTGSATVATLRALGPVLRRFRNLSHHICIAYQTQQKREEKKCTAVVANDKSDDDQAEQRLEQRPHVIVESSDLVWLVSLPEAPENGIEGHKAVVDKQVTLPD